MPGELPTMSVIIPARNEAGYIGKCLDSILGGDYPLDRLQVMVFVAPGRDGTAEIVEGYAKKHRGVVEYHKNDTLYAPHAFNLGVKLSRGDVIIILSAHAEVGVDWFGSIARALEERPDADGVGGVLETSGSDFWGRAVSLAMSSPFGVGNNSFRVGGKSGFVDTVVFGAYRREVFRRVGMFDEEMIRNQDDEFNYRIVKGGGKLYFSPSIRSRYFVRSNLRMLWRQYAQYGYWKPLVYRKCPGVYALRQFAPPVFASGIIMLLAGSIVSPAPFYFLLAGLGSYAALSLVFSLIYFKKNRLYSFVLPLVYFCMHLSYGLNFLKGVMHFLILKRNAVSGAYTALTRQ